jgi:hypothetical protein
MRVVRALAAVGACLLGGCIPWAILLPPTQVTLGGAGIGGGGGAFQMRAGIHPLQFHPSLVDRIADAGAGFVLDLGGSDASRNEGGRIVRDGVGVWGFYLEGAAVVANAPMYGRVGDLQLNRFRALARGQARLAWADAPYRGISSAGPGVGFAAQLAVEAVGFENRGFSGTGPDGVAFGVSYGEASVGLYVEGGYTQFAGGGLWSIGGGILFRFPFVAALGCLPWPDTSRVPPARPAQPPPEPSSPPEKPPARPAAPPARPADRKSRRRPRRWGESQSPQPPSA